MILGEARESAAMFYFAFQLTGSEPDLRIKSPPLSALYLLD